MPVHTLLSRQVRLLSVVGGASKGKLPPLDKFGYDDVKRGRKSRVFLADVHKHALAQGREPQDMLELSLTGTLRDHWNDVKEAWLIEHPNAPMSWEQTQQSFRTLLSEDLTDPKEQARTTLFSSQMKQQPNESMRAFVARFRAATLLLGTDLSADIKVHLFITNLCDEIYKAVGRQPSGQPWQTVEEAIKAAIGAEDRLTLNAGPDAKRARTTAHSAPTQAALAITAAPPQPAYDMQLPPPYVYPMMGPYMPYAPMHHIQTPLPPPMAGQWQPMPAPVAAPVAAPPPPLPANNNKHSGFKRNGVQKPRYSNKSTRSDRPRGPPAPNPPFPHPDIGVPGRVQMLYDHIKRYRDAILDSDACIRCGSLPDSGTHNQARVCDGSGPFYRALNLSKADVDNSTVTRPPECKPPTQKSGRQINH
jgi:hypothetical protein